MDTSWVTESPVESVSHQSMITMTVVSPVIYRQTLSAKGAIFRIGTVRYAEGL